MKNHLLSLCLLVAINADAQYKRFGVNAIAGMSNHSPGYDYTCQDLLVQYNFKKTFSVVTGLERETGQFNIFDFYEFPYPIRNDYSSVSFSNWSIPLMGRATFGKKRVFLFLQAGAQVYGTPKATGEVDRHYSTSDPNYPDEHFTTTYEIHPQSNWAIVYGGGLTVSITENLQVFGEFRDNPYKQYTPSSYKDDLRSYSHFSGGRVLVGISWQFNVRKESEYAMKTYYPRIKLTNE